MTGRRLVRRTPAKLSHRFAAGVADATQVTVTITGGDGLAIDGSPFTATVTGGVAEVDLTAAQLPAVDLLTVEWDVGGGHVERDVVPVDGAAYVPLARLTEVAKDRDADQVETVLWEVVDRVEEFVGIPFVPRFAVHRMTPRYTTRSVLLRYPVLEVLAIVVDGLELIGDYTIETSGRLTLADDVLPADAAVEVRYVRGLPHPPADLTGAVIDTVEQLANERYGRSQQPARQQFAGDAGGMSWVIGNPDPERGRLFGINRVDGVFKMYRDRWRGAVVA
jgi:hypothetical protein